MTRPNILLVQSSARRDGSVTRDLAARLADRLGGAVTVRDLADGVELIDADWIGANFTDPAERDRAQAARLAASDEMVAELRAADVIVIGAPIYNFGVPAALKAWIDLVARARETFRYTDTGPVGLLTGKKAYIVLASGGTARDSAIDFATPWLRHVLGFVGIDDVEVIAADRLMVEGEAKREAAAARIDSLTGARLAA